MIEIILLVVIGIIIVIVNYSIYNKMAKCPEKKVVYNYIPRTQGDLDSIKVPRQDVLGATQELFDRASPWVERVNNRREGLNENNINQYYISQY